MPTEPEVYKSEEEELVAVFLMCQLLAKSRSKDPKTKVGACVYDWYNMHFGYNGLPESMYDRKDIWDENCADYNISKHDVVTHAEMNAIIKALAAGAPMYKSVLICTLKPCIECAKLIAASGIKKAVWPASRAEAENPDKNDKVLIALGLAGVECAAISPSHEIHLLSKEEKECSN